MRANAPTFSDVDLGPHENRLRQMVKTGDPGQTYEYPIFALVDRTGMPNSRILVAPFRARFDGHTVYQAIFGGCMWIYGVSRHRSPTLSKIALQANGFLWIIPERWEATAYLQDVSRVLQRAAL